MKKTTFIVVLGGATVLACGGSTGDTAPGSGALGDAAAGGADGSTVSSGGSGALGVGGARVDTGGAAARGGAGGAATGGVSGTGGIPVGGTGGTNVCCFSGCDEPCTPAQTRTCGFFPDHPGQPYEQDCRCDGTGWQHVRSPTTTGGTCAYFDAGRRVDAAANGGAPSDSDAGTYCVYEAPGAGGSPSTHCLPLPSGCASCSCITLPYSFCTCSDTGGDILVRCLGA